MARNFIFANTEEIQFGSSLGTILNASPLNNTFLAKYRTDSVTFGSDRTIMALGSTTNASSFHCLIKAMADGQIRAFVQSDSGSENAVSFSTTLITANKWHTVGQRKAGNTVEVILDGVLIDPKTPPTFGTWSAGNTFDLGALAAGSSTRVGHGEGDIAEVAAWDVNLTQSEIDSYHAGMSPLLIRPQNLIFYSPLYGTTNEVDLSGEGNGTGTLINTPAIASHPPVSPFKPRATYNQSALLRQKQLEHIYRENLTDESQTSTTFRTILTVEKAALVPLAKYWIFVTGNISSNNATNVTKVRVLNNSVEELGSLSLQAVKTVIGSSDGLDYHFSKVLNIPETPGDIELQIANSSTSETHMDQSMIFMLRLDKDFKEGRDYIYEENQLISPYSTSFGNDTAFSNKIESPIELLGSGEEFFAVMNMTTLSNTTLDDLRKNQLQFVLPGISYAMDIINRTAAEEQLSVKGGIATFPSVSGFIAQTKFAVNNAGSENQHKWSSCFILRKNLFAQAIAVTNVANQLPTDTVLNQTLDLAITPTVVGDFVAFGFASVGFEAGSTAGLRNGLIAFRNGGTVIPTGEDGDWGADSETLNERNPLTTMAYFPNLPASAQTIELMVKGNQASQVNFSSRTAFLISLLPANRFKIQGVVQESGSNVSRTVRAFLSSTGEFLGEAISNSDTGKYEITDLPGGNVFVVAFDDSSGDSFNAKIFDKVVPVS